MYWTTPAGIYVGSMEGLFGPRPALYPSEQLWDAERELRSLMELVCDFFNLTEDSRKFGDVLANLHEIPPDRTTTHYLKVGLMLLEAWASIGYRPSIVSGLAIVARMAHQFAVDVWWEELGSLREDVQFAAVALQVMALRRYEDLLAVALKDGTDRKVEYFSHFFEDAVTEWTPAQQRGELRKVRAALARASLTLSKVPPLRLVPALQLLMPGERPVAQFRDDRQATRSAADRPEGTDEQLEAFLAGLAADDPPASPPAAVAPPAPAVPALELVLSPGLQVSAKGVGRGMAPFAVLAKPMPLGGAGRRARDVVAALEGHAPWAVDLIAHVRRELALRERMGHGFPQLAPILLHGPPGSGKTAVVSALADALGLPMERIDAGASSDSRDLAGTAAGWSSALPSRPVAAIVRAGVANPLVLVDEVEKAASSRSNGCVAATLLGMVEPGTAGRYFDEALRAEVDIGRVTWVMTANDASKVPAPLRSRLAMVRVDRPGPEFADRAVGRVLAGIAEEMGGTAAMLPDLPQQVLDQVRKHFAGGADLRRVKAALRAAVSLQMDAAVLH